MKIAVSRARRQRLSPQHRKGVFFVLAVICLMGAMTFVGMSVDLGMITLTKTRMQAAADAAALSAAQEIVVAVRDASWNSESGLDMDAVQTAAAADARAMAEYVASMNGFYLDPDTDVTLGRRLLSSDGVTYTESWGTGPFNCVKVDIRKNNADASAPDAKLPLRQRLRPRGFMLVLVGKDGVVELRKPLPWTVREITRSIDKMPIRQREVEERRHGSG